MPLRWGEQNQGTGTELLRHERISIINCTRFLQRHAQNIILIENFWTASIQLIGSAQHLELSQCCIQFAYSISDAWTART